jgi:myo-inositol-1(or 4)-monophosphatase
MASTSAVSDAVAIPAPAELERIAGEAARAGARQVAAGYGGARAVARKSSPTDVVTQTDLDAERVVRELVLEATPDAGLLGEEGGGTAPASRLQWVVDPLDGTVNFLYGVPLFAVSIAAAVDGEVVAGAVIDVLRDELFSAHLAGGARCDGRPVTASGCEQLADALAVTGFSYQADLRARQGDVVRRLLPLARDVRAFGSSALELCWVACGRVDGYFERDIKIWDYSAGALIAAESGAVTELPCPENEDLMIAATPGIFEALRAAVELSAA